MSLLSVNGLRISYTTAEETREVVHGVSFDIQAGEVVAVVGESGSGKTTVAQSVIGLLPANGKLGAGEILLNGENIAGWSPKRMQGIRGSKIGLIPQDPSSSLNPVKTIGAQIGEVFTIHKRGNSAEAKKRVIELLERVGLSEPERRAGQYPHELSGGMRQRVLIAIAIALRPQLIIADEATSALDVTVQRRVLDLLDDLRAESGTAILFVTHDLAVAADRADRLLVMRDGSIEEQGPTAEVMTAATSSYTRQLLRDAPSLGTATFRPLLAAVAADAAPAVPAVEAIDLVKEFGGKRGQQPFRALDGVSFSIARGTTHALVGESGSGKSTTARLIMRFEQQSSGTVRIDGDDVAGLKREGLRALRRRIQLVYQNPFGSLDPLQSVGSLIAEPMKNFAMGTRPERAKRAAELLDLVALPQAFAERRPRELSGGQRQRVAIARALALDPEILILDEAVSALDVTVQAQILDLLASLQQQLGLTYLFISHDLAVVRQISDTISVMSRGRIVETGTTRDVLLRPASEYTRELLDAVPGTHRTDSAPR